MERPTILRVTKVGRPWCSRGSRRRLPALERPSACHSVRVATRSGRSRRRISPSASIPPETNKAFAQSLGVDFPILSDPSKTAAEASRCRGRGSTVRVAMDLLHRHRRTHRLHRQAGQPRIPRQGRCREARRARRRPSSSDRPSLTRPRQRADYRSQSFSRENESTLSSCGPISSRSESAHFANGARLGGYEILSMLGAGGMGEVYRARDEKLGRDVAINVAGNGGRLRSAAADFLGFRIPSHSSSRRSTSSARRLPCTARPIAPRPRATAPTRRRSRQSVLWFR